MPPQYEDVFERLVLKKFRDLYYKAYDRAFVMAFDSEYFQSGAGNVILTYQISTLAAGMEKQADHVEYVPRGKRLRLAEIIELGLRSLDPAKNLPPRLRKSEKPRKGMPEPPKTYRGKDLVLLVAHNIVAEWSALADRDEPHITKRLNVIRKSPVTSFLPIKIHLTDYRPVDVRLFDTMLLAPAGQRSLKALSSLLADGEADSMKLSVGQFYLENMNLYLRDYPDEFDAYARRDSQVTLKVFLHLQRSLNELAYGHFEKPFLTLASAGVARFLSEDTVSTKFVMEMADYKKDPRPDLTRFIKRSYLGGRNESLFRGRTWDYSHTDRKAWVDIDFVGCYPSAMALVPRIDLNRRALYLPLRYRIDGKVAKKLRELGVTEEQIKGAREALALGKEPLKAFDQYLAGLTEEVKGRKRRASRKADLIREHATVVDNRLIKRWLAVCPRPGKGKPLPGLESYIIPGFARVRFEFKNGTLYPCLPVKHLRYGLIYPLNGETVATAPEILLALHAGATIKAVASLELVTVTDESAGELDGALNFSVDDFELDGRKSFGTSGLEKLPHRFFLEHLEKILGMRADYAKKAKSGDKGALVFERLLKEFSNSFYGKFAQSVNEKKTYRVSTGEMTYLRPSQVTVPYIASLTTGLARAALSATLLAVARFNERRREPGQKITVISCTTDGILIGLPLPEGFSEDYSVADDFYTMLPVKDKEKSQRPGAVDFYPKIGLKPAQPDPEKPDELIKAPLEEILARYDCDELIADFETFLPIRQMRGARQELVGNDTYLEVKHLADQILSVKTRGQVGFLRNGFATVLARFNLKPPITDIALDKYGSNPTYEEVLKAKDDYREIMDGAGAIRDREEAHWILGHYDRVNPVIRTRPFEAGALPPGPAQDEIATYNFYGLYPFRKILESGGKKDLTQTKGSRMINIDYEWKRKLKVSVSPAGETSFLPESTPFETLGEMQRFRSSMEGVRRAKAVATPERVHHRVQVRGRFIRFRGGEGGTLIRMFLRGFLHGHLRAASKRGTYSKYAEKLNELCRESGFLKKIWSEKDFKSAKRGKWEPGRLRVTLPQLEFLEKLSSVFEVDFQKARSLLFFDETANIDTGAFVPPGDALVLEVVKAVLFAPEMGLEPLRRLYLEGCLPTKAGMLKVFESHFLTAEALAICERQGFIAGRVESGKRRRVKGLFMLMGLTSADAEACALMLSPRSGGGRKEAKNPSRKRCLEQYVMAVNSQDVNPLGGIEEKVILKALSRYGLTRRVYRQRLAEGSPTQRSLRDTPGNVGQIRRMAAALEVDPGPILAFLIDRKPRKRMLQK